MDVASNRFYTSKERPSRQQLIQKIVRFLAIYNFHDTHEGLFLSSPVELVVFG